MKVKYKNGKVIIKKISDKKRDKLIAKYGVGHEEPVTSWFMSSGLKKYIIYDEFGVRKKDNVKIPFKYLLEYNIFKKDRIIHIISKYYKFSCKSFIETPFNVYYYNNTFTIPSEFDIIEMNKLIRMG